jgi:Ca-activated chloride channel homolog
MVDTFLSQYGLVTVLIAVALALLAEWLHARRIKRVRFMAFGPRGLASPWTGWAWLVRTVSIGVITWGMLMLLAIGSEAWSGGPNHASDSSTHHLVIALDVSPSMKIADSGATRKQSRADRAREVLLSILGRIDIRRTKVSIVAFYSKSLPVVVDTVDPAVVYNVLSDLPLEQAFRAGKTDLYSIIVKTNELSRAWRSGSGSLIVVSDGDTLPATETPRLPVAFERILVLGVGDPVRGTFIHDHTSKQDRRSLEQFALQLHGEYIDVNLNQVATNRLPTGPATSDTETEWAWREIALSAIALGTSVLALLPVFLSFAGCRWSPTRSTSVALNRTHFDQVQI